MLDPAAAGVWLLCDPNAEKVPLEAEVSRILLSLDVDPAAADLEFLVAAAVRTRRQRVRFVGVKRTLEEEGRRCRMRVALEWNGTIFGGEATGEAGPLQELRAAAAAALVAVQQVAGGEPAVRLTGVKQIRAFDSDLVLVSLFHSAAPPERLVGTVMVAGDPVRAAALAVLSALNRLLGNYLRTTD